MTGKRWTLAWLVQRHPRVALDANVLIYLLEGAEQGGREAAALIDAIAEGSIDGSMATVGEVEILAGPAARGDSAAFERTVNEMRDLGLRLIPLSSAIAADAAWLRGQGGVGLPDAIHLATARAVGATAFVTNDRRIRSRPNLAVLTLDDFDVDTA